MQVVSWSFLLRHLCRKRREDEPCAARILAERRRRGCKVNIRRVKSGTVLLFSQPENLAKIGFDPPIEHRRLKAAACAEPQSLHGGGERARATEHHPQKFTQRTSVLSVNICCSMIGMWVTSLAGLTAAGLQIDSTCSKRSNSLALNYIF